MICQGKRRIAKLRKGAKGVKKSWDGSVRDPSQVQGPGKWPVKLRPRFLFRGFFHRGRGGYKEQSDETPPHPVPSPECEGAGGGNPYSVFTEIFQMLAILRAQHRRIVEYSYPPWSTTGNSGERDLSLTVKLFPNVPIQNIFGLALAWKEEDWSDAIDWSSRFYAFPITGEPESNSQDDYGNRRKHGRKQIRSR